MSLTLQIGATTAALDTWGLAAPQLRRVNQAADTLSIIHQADIDASALVAYGATVILKDGATQRFIGRRILNPRAGSPAAETQQLTFAGPWWYIDNCVYQQDWGLWDAALEVITAQRKGRLILGQDAAGARITNAACITAVLQYVLDVATENGYDAPFAIGTIFTGVEFPWDEVHDLLCGEVIRRMLRYTPDVATWFDYSTTPPTLHMQRRALLSTVTYAIAAGDTIDTIEITSRPDLQVPAVVLKYEQTHTDGDNVYESLTEDKYPPAATGTDFGTLVMTMELGGLNVSYLTQEVGVAALPTSGAPPVADLNNETWWKSHVKWLNDAKVTNLSFAGGTRSGSKALPNELLLGQIHRWMNKQFEQETFRVRVTYRLLDADSNTSQEKTDIIEVDIVTTDAAGAITTDVDGNEQGKLYRVIDPDAAIQVPEAIPAGLAESLYTALNTLSYEGAYTILQDECTGALRPGLCLNLTGGLAAWATMAAFIQDATEDFETGRTTVAFGPPTHLGPADLLELLRPNRERGTAQRFSLRAAGDTDDSGKASPMSGRAVLENGNTGPGETTKLVLRKAGTPVKYITIDIAGISTDAAVTEIKLRDVYLFDPASRTFQKRQVMCSENYGTAVAGTKALPDGSNDNEILRWEASGTPAWVVSWPKLHA